MGGEAHKSKKYDYLISQPGLFIDRRIYKIPIIDPP